MTDWPSQHKPFVAYWRQPDGAVVTFLGWIPEPENAIKLSSGQFAPICSILPLSEADAAKAVMPDWSAKKATCFPSLIAAQFLIHALSDGARSVASLAEDATRYGIAWAAIVRAKKRLGVVSIKQGGRKGNSKEWLWHLPGVKKTKSSKPKAARVSRAGRTRTPAAKQAKVSEPAPAPITPELEPVATPQTLPAEAPTTEPKPVTTDLPQLFAAFGPVMPLSERIKARDIAAARKQRARRAKMG